MKKVVTSLLSLIVFSALFSQVPFGIKISEISKNEYSDIFSGYLTNDNHLLFLKRTGEISWNVARYNAATMQQISSTPLISNETSPSNILKPIFTPLNFVELNNKIYVILTTQDTKNKKAIFFLQEIDANGEKTGDLKNIGFFKNINIGQPNSFYTKVSDNNMYCAIVKESRNINSEFLSFESIIYNSEANKIKITHKNTDLIIKETKTKQISLSNNGQVAILVKQELNNSLRPSTMEETTDRLYISDGEYSYNQVDITLPNYAIETMEFQWYGNKQNILFNGTCSEIQNIYGGDDIDGLFTLTINPTNARITSSKIYTLPTSLILRENDKKEKQLIKSEGISNGYMLRKIYNNTDSSQWIVLEKTLYNESRVFSTTAIEDKDLYSYRFLTLLVLKIDTSGNVLNYCFVPKKQITFNDRAYASSFLGLHKNNKLYLFFNDYTKNVSSDFIPIDDVKTMRDPQFADFFCAEINNDGTFKKYLILKNDRRSHLTFIPTSYIASNNSNYIGITTTSKIDELSDKMSIGYFNIVNK